ncbi:MAG TPA: relaxase/mobilization nuclease domain-containing protein, partial [Longimicrobiaceae bacterium]|nr:relaxase/mobilization nuclease domain-containing protein [Longimicrobiaceae bacterium]
MIAKVTKGSGFAGLVRYLETGKDGASPDRVDWVEARNLATDDPRTAAILMRATAHQSDRVEKPVYHLSISFDHGDPIDQPTISRVADRVLSDLGLEEHQVLMVAHRDKAHAHVHLAINRVHPETERAWDPSHDYARVEQSLRRQERELGLREVPGHHFQLDGQEPPDRSETLTSGQVRKWERTGHLPFDELVRKTVAPDFREAGSWEELEERLARRGLRLEPRGRGLVVTD